jgi:hypothetical protein
MGDTNHTHDTRAAAVPETRRRSSRSPASPIVVLALREGGESRFSFVCVLVLGHLGFRVSSINVMVEPMLMVLVGIIVSQPMLLSSEATLALSRGLWSPSCWSGFDLALSHGVATGIGYSWSAAGLSAVVCLRNTVGDPAA